MDKIQEIIDKIDNKLDLVDDVFGCKTNNCWEDLCETVGDLKEALSKQTDTPITQVQHGLKGKWEYAKQQTDTEDCYDCKYIKCLKPPNFLCKKQ